MKQWLFVVQQYLHKLLNRQGKENYTNLNTVKVSNSPLEADLLWYKVIISARKTIDDSTGK